MVINVLGIYQKLQLKMCALFMWLCQKLIFNKCVAELSIRGIKYENDELIKNAINIMYAKNKENNLVFYNDFFIYL